MKWLLRENEFMRASCMPSVLRGVLALLIGLALLSPSPALGDITTHVKKVERALGIHEEGGRIIALVRALDAVPEKEIPELGKALKPLLVKHPYRRNLAFTLFPHWLPREPLVVMSFADDVEVRHVRDLLMQVAMGVWTRHDPVAALKYIDGVVEDQMKERLVVSYTVQMQHRNPRHALEITLKYFGLGSRREITVRRIFEAWVKNDLKGALSAVETLKVANERRGVVYVIGEYWRGQDPARAFQWLLSQGRSTQEEALKVKAFGDWSRADMEAANAWLSRETREPGYYGAMGAAMAEIKPGSVTEWVVGLPKGKGRELAGSRAVEVIAGRKPAEAARLLSVLGLEGNSSILRTIGRHWAATDFAATLKWLRGLNQQDRGFASSELFSKVTGNLKELGGVVAGINEASLRMTVAIPLVYRWASSQPEEVFAWIAGLPKEQQLKLFEQAVLWSLRRDAEATAKLVDQYLGETAPAAMVENVLRAWGQRDRVASAAWAAHRKGAQATVEGARQFLGTKGLDDVAEVEKFIAGITDATVRRKALGFWVDRHSALDPMAALAWLNDPRFTGDPRADLHGVMLRAANKDEAPTRRTVLAVADEKHRERLLSHLVPIIAGKDAEAAFRWLLELEKSGIKLPNQYRYVGTRLARDKAAVAAAMALEIADDQTRKYALANIILLWLGQERPATLQFIKEVEEPALKQYLYSQTAANIARKEPEVAIRIASELEASARIAALARVLDEWIENDAKAAADWIDQAPEKDRSKLIEASAYDLAKKIPVRLATMAVSLKAGRARANSLRTAVNYWGKEEPEDALEFVAKLPSPSEQYGLAREILKNATSKYVALIPDLLKRIPSEETRFKVFDFILSDWLRRDTRMTVKWMSANLNESQRITASGRINSYSIKGGLEELNAFIRTLPEKHQPVPFRALASAWFKTDVDRAMKWLEGMEAGPARTAALETGVQQLAFKDVKQAGELARQVEDEGKQSHLFGVVAGRAFSHGESGFDWLKTVKKGTNYFQSVASGMYALAQKAPRSPLAFSTNLASEPLRIQAMYQIGSSWGRLEPGAALDAFLKLPDGPERTKGVTTVIARWAGQDAHTAASILDGLKPDALKRAAITKFVQEIYYQEPSLAADWMFKVNLDNLSTIPVEISMRLLEKDREKGKRVMERLPEKLKKQALDRARRRRLL